MAEMTTLQIAQNREKAFGALWARMDETRDRLYMTAYKLKGQSGIYKGKEIPGVISVTMNTAAVLANTIVSSLLSSRHQCQVEGTLSDSARFLIERFVEDALAEADEYLHLRGEPGLFPFVCNHVCHRGYIGARYLWRQDEETGEPYPEILPTDMRYATYEVGLTGLKWFAPKYFRSKAELQDEYPGARVTGDTDIEVVDFWDDEKEEVWIDGRLAKSQKHSLGYVPFVVASPAVGFMLRDKGYLEHEAEDLFFLNRELFDEENRSVSIEQTINMKLILPPYQKPTASMEKEPAQYPGGLGNVSEVAPGEEYQLLPTADINVAHQQATRSIANALAKGGIDPVDLGIVDQSGVSAVRITEQTAIRTKIIQPRLDCLANFKSMLAMGLIKGYTAGKYDASIGKSGQRKPYAAAKLGNPEEYTVAYRLMSKDKRQEIANIAIAQAAQSFYGPKWIHENILMTDDVAGALAELDAAKAEAADPVLFYLRKACSLADEAESLEGEEADQKKLESMMLTEQGVSLLRQRNMQPQPGQQGEMPGQPKSASNALIPLMGQQGLKGG